MGKVLYVLTLATAPEAKLELLLSVRKLPLTPIVEVVTGAVQIELLSTVQGNCSLILVESIPIRVLKSLVTSVANVRLTPVTEPASDSESEAANPALLEPPPWFTPTGVV